MKFLVIGGGGYIGFHIAKAFTLLGHSVSLMDVHFPSEDWLCSPYLPNSYLMKGLSGLQHTEEPEVLDDPLRLHSFVTPGDVDNQFEITVFDDSGHVCSFEFFKVDITKKPNLHFYFQELGRIDCVVHTASYGMSGLSQLQRFTKSMEEVNIQGLKNVIECSAQIGVKSFIYTSTYNVVFGGQLIKCGDESLSYFPLVDHVDSYSRTKSIAEQILLTADKKNGMRTCALRLAGVMGPMEERHLPRVINNLEKGLLVINYRDVEGSVVDFVGIQNVVQAHVKASLKLIENGELLGGESYFISDGSPINNMEYFRPLIESQGRLFPNIFIPLWFMWIIIMLIEYLANFFCFTPLLTRAELYKTSVTHYFSILKAGKDFDYKPTDPNDMSLVIRYYNSLRTMKTKRL